MLSNRLAKAVLLAGVLQSGLVHALGVGEISLKSSLNQPLEASIPLRDVGELSEAEILVKLADRATYQESGIDRPQFLSKLKFSVEVNEAGVSQIRVTTQEPVVEPYLDFIVELRWPNGRMLREYTLLLDLPQYGGDSAPVQAAQRSAVPSPAVTSNTEAESAAKKSEVVEPGGARGPAAPTAPEARPETQQTALPPADDPDEYRIQHKDTMWRLAERFRPSAMVTTQQTMIAIYNKNPDAFIGNNINQIKSGYVLRLPSESEVQAVDPYQAMSDIRAQNRRWRGEAPAAASAAAPAEAEGTAPQVDATKSAEPTAPAQTGGDSGRFSLSAGSDGEAGGGDVADLERQLQEEKDALEKAQLENQSMQARVTEMETQIDTLQKLIALKNRQLAALQGGVSESELADADAQNLQDSAAESASDDSQVDAAVSDTSAADTDTADQSDTAAQSEPESQDTQTAPAKPEAVAPAPSEPWYSNRMVHMLLGALVILVLLVLALRQRAKSRDEDEPKYEPVIEGDDDTGYKEAAGAGGAAVDFDQLAEEPTSEATGTGEQAEGGVFASGASLDLDDLDDLDLDKPAADSDQIEDGADWQQSAAWESASEGGTESVQPQTDDVMSEAEIYVAYGRYDQASSLLKNAIAQDPDNTALRVKLIDLYLDTRDRDNFQQAFAELKESGDEEAVARVKESMSAIEGVSDWLEEPSVSSSAPGGEGASLDALDDELAFLDSDIDSDFAAEASDDSEQSDLDASFASALDDAALEPSAQEEPSAQDEPSAYDEPSAEQSPFAESDLEQPESASDNTFEVDFEEAQRDADGDLDFDSEFDLGDLDAAISEADSEANDQAPVAGGDDSFAESAEDDAAELDMDLSDFELDTLEPQPADADIGLAADTETPELDANSEDTSSEEDLSALDMDLSDFNFDADEAAADADREMQTATAEPESLELGEELSADLSSDFSSSDFSSDDSDADFGDSLASDDDVTADNAQDGDLQATDQGSEFDFENDGSEEALNALMEAADAEADGELSADYADELMQTQDDTVASPEATPEATPGAADDGDLDVEELVFDEFDADPEEGGEFSLGSDADEVATKLDLARAYVDMGDKDGAREILDEVLEEGDDAQRNEAQGLIDQL